MQRKNLFSKILSIGIFFLVLFSAFLQHTFHLLPELPNKENRRLKEKPVFNINLLDPFPVGYEAYYNDHFAFRNHLVKVYSNLSLDLFGKSPYPEQVILGRKRNLFLVPKELETYQRTNFFTREDLDKMRSDFTYRNRYFEKKGIDYYVAICPTKYSVYPELLPWYVRPFDTVSRTDQFISLLKSIGVQVIDLRKSLLAAKDSVPGELYMATDNHWNEIGAFIAYQDIMSHIIHKHPEVRLLHSSDFHIQPQKRNGGNLANIINRQEEMTDIRYNFMPKYPNRSSMIQPCPYPVPPDFEASEYYKGYYTRGSKLPNIMIVHDSFGKYVHPYFRDSFSRSTFIWDKWQYKINEPIVEAEKPAIYVTLCLESLLQGLADNCEYR